MYLQQYPQGERLEVSTGGGDGPVWRSDGKELFFHGYALDGSSGGQDYDILPDGRFVMVRSAAPADIREIVVVQNWFEALKRRAPVR